jgi:cytochrome c oxidase subunit 2
VAIFGEVAHASALFPREASTIAPWMDALYFFLLA